MQEDLYGKDAQLDYEMDSVGDAQDEWRCEWALALNEAEDSEKMKTYRGKREGLYEMMEGYYKQRTAKDGPYVVPGAALCRPDTCAYWHSRACAALPC